MPVDYFQTVYNPSVAECLSNVMQVEDWQLISSKYGVNQFLLLTRLPDFTALILRIWEHTTPVSVLHQLSDSPVNHFCVHLGTSYGSLARGSPSTKDQATQSAYFILRNCSYIGALASIHLPRIGCSRQPVRRSDVACDSRRLLRRSVPVQRPTPSVPSSDYSARVGAVDGSVARYGALRCLTHCLHSHHQGMPRCPSSPGSLPRPTAVARSDDAARYSICAPRPATS